MKAWWLTRVGVPVIVATVAAKIIGKRFAGTDWLTDVTPMVHRLLKYQKWDPAESGSNPLLEWVLDHSEGNVLYKAAYNFDVYDDHLSKFRGKPVRMLVLGVQSGGEIGMWQEYFGPRVKFVGIDINPACKKLETQYSNTTIYVGDASDRSFLADVRAKAGPFDIVIDDASHLPPHQIFSLQSLLTALEPGGVFIVDGLHVSRANAGPLTLAAVLVGSLAQRGLKFTIRQFPALWAWGSRGDFLAFVMAFVQESLRSVGPGGECWKGTPHSDSRACSCAPSFLVQSVHTYTDSIALRLRPRVQLAKEARRRGDRPLPVCTEGQDTGALTYPPSEDKACQALGII